MKNSIIAYCSFVTRLKNFFFKSFSSFALLLLHYSIFKLPICASYLLQLLPKFLIAHIYFKLLCILLNTLNCALCIVHCALKSWWAQCGQVHLYEQASFPFILLHCLFAVFKLLGGHKWTRTTDLTLIRRAL